MDKNELRNYMKKRRRMLTQEEIAQKSAQITDNLFKFCDFSGADVVMVYMSAFKEPSTEDIIRRLAEKGKKIVVPISDTESHTIIPSYISVKDGEAEQLKSGAYGISEPQNIRTAAAEDIDAVIVPGLAFDARGYRCGFGAGYYDRFLKQCSAPSIGLCYDFQLIEEIDAQPLDMAVNAVVTERRIIHAF